MALDATREESQDILLDVVENDPELFIRRLAIRRLNKIDALQALRHAGQNGEIYQEATTRLCILLSNNTCELSIDQLKAKLDSLNETGIFQYVVKHTNIKEMQRYVLDKINDESAIVEVVVNAENDEVRKLALEKLESTSALKRVVKALKRKDKQLAARAQEKLQELDSVLSERNTLINEHKRVSKDFLELVELCKLSKEWCKNESRLRSLHEQWRGLCVQLGRQDNEQDDEQVEQSYKLFEAELKHAVNKQSWEVSPEVVDTDVIDKLRSINEQLSQKLQQYEKLDINKLPDGSELTQFAADIRRQWQQNYNGIMEEAGAALPVADLPQAKSEFEANFSRLEQYLAELPVIEAYRSQLVEILADAKNVLASEGSLSKRDVEHLQQRYKKLSRPVNALVAQQMIDQYNKAIDDLQKRLAAQDDARSNILSDFNTLIRELKEAVEKGQSKHAARLVHRGKKLLKQLDDEGKSLLNKSGTLATFHHAEQQLTDLQSWRQWSNAPVKEKLIREVSDLVQELEANKDNPDFDFVNAADMIKAARNEWKKLTTGEHDSDQELWQQFDAVCNQAYEPCQQYFDQQAEQRAANLSKREQFCQDLEAYQQKVANQEPGEVDWKAMDKIIHAARKDWGQLGVVNRGDRARINKRYNSVFHALEKLLRTHQQQNREIKETLIKRIQSLSSQLSEQSIDVDQAVESVKQAQAEWKTVGVARKDLQVWQQFREACDKVFQVRRAEQDALNEARETEKQQRNQLIKQIEAASKLNGESLLQARSQIDQLKSEWDQLPRLKKDHPQERRLLRACQEFEKQIKNEYADKLRLEKQKLQQNVGLCNELEQAIFDCLQGTADPAQLTDSVATLQERWQTVSSKLSVVDQAVQERFDQLKEYSGKIGSDGIEAVKPSLLNQDDVIAEKKEMLCIRLEVLADVESPPESRQRRMEYQVSQLADKMKQSKNHNVQAEIAQLLSQWHGSGFMDPNKAQPLERRFYSTLQSLDKDYQYEM
ncbi:DUF349 domain-containing protein [Kaarinaea lacus]